MTKEQEEAIRYLEKHINYFKEQIKFIEEIDCDYYDEEYELYKNRVKQFETVLNMLKEKDKEIEKYSAYKKEFKTLNKQLKNKDKIIDLMAEEIDNSILNTCPYANYGIDLDCENSCDDNSKECWKQYFKSKAEKE